MAMQMYEGRRSIGGTEPSAKMGKGSLYFNHAAVEAFLDTKKPFCLVGYDKETRQIGVKPQVIKFPNSLTFNFRKDGGQIKDCLLNVSGFYKQFKLENLKGKLFTITLTDDGSMLLLTAVGEPKEATPPAPPYVPKSECPKQPVGRPPKPADNVVFKCASCGYSPAYWRNRKQFPFGHPAVCKCRHTVFVEEK